jgi:hypothetical protein
LGTISMQASFAEGLARQTLRSSIVLATLG